MRASLGARAERMSAGHVDVDGLVGHRGDDVVGVGNPGVAENIVYLDPRNDVAKYLN